MSRLINETTNYTKEAQGGVVTHAVAGGATPAQRTGMFPRGGLSGADPKDELMREKMEFLTAAAGNNQPAMTPMGLVTASDSDFEWLQRKRDTEAMANLDQWVGTNFHTGDVATRKWLQETYPEYYESRERLMVDRAKFALRVKLLLLRGPKTQKDLVLQWGLQTGRIKLDRDWDRIGPDGSRPFTAADEQNRFGKGLFSPSRYLSDHERNTNAAFGTAGGAGGVAAGGQNPFMPGGPGQNDGQVPGFFPNGQAVPGVPVNGIAPPRYPGFLTTVIANAYN